MIKSVHVESGHLTSTDSSLGFISRNLMCANVRYFSRYLLHSLVDRARESGCGWGLGDGNIWRHELTC